MFEFLAQRFSGGFEGELLWPGHLGQFFILLSFVGAFVAFIAYLNAERNRSDRKWVKLGRWAFILHGVSVVSIFAILFFLILNHRFEYHYVWRHSSLDLPLRYIISCFWEGQEGSFLLWTFWHVVLGLILIRKAKDWEAPVMTVVSFAQWCLAGMVIGLYVFEFKFGSNPFLLLRDVMVDAPIFQLPNYLDFVKDGNGLNPLLQNYWMVIHPPVLFLGFASTLIPFAYALAGLYRQKHNEWIKPALPWALFSAGILSTGVLMGGAWAYEALSFGGFWAWDPVENASMVPWLTLVAGLHTMLIYKHTGNALRMTYIFYFLTFMLVLYSTYLTRSGDLGDSSVHSFTDLGMRPQLVGLLLVFAIPSIILFIIRYKKIPSIDKEEALWSREFWMFIGSLFLLLSAIQITFTTSLPIFNKLFNTNLAPPEDVVGSYNQVQIWFSIIIVTLTAVVQYFSYKRGGFNSFFKWVYVSLFVAVVCGLGLTHIFEIPYISSFTLLMVFSLFAFIANAVYLAKVLKGKLKLSGGSLAHIGFALLLLGILISQGKQQPISFNSSGQLFEGYDEVENAINKMLVKNIPSMMGDYQLTYLGDSVNGVNHYYRVNYKMVKEGEVVQEFDLYPNAQINPEMGLVANPSTKHYWNKDIFTHITSIPDQSVEENFIDTFTLAVGDTFYTHAHQGVLLAIRSPQSGIAANSNVLVVQAGIEFEHVGGKSYRLSPEYKIFMNEGNRVESPVAISTNDVLEARLLQVLPNEEKVKVVVEEKKEADAFIIMKAIVFPYINILWLGCILMVLGFFVSSFNRAKQVR